MLIIIYVTAPITSMNAMKLEVHSSLLHLLGELDWVMQYLKNLKPMDCHLPFAETPNGTYPNFTHPGEVKEISSLSSLCDSVKLSRLDSSSPGQY